MQAKESAGKRESDGGHLLTQPDRPLITGSSQLFWLTDSWPPTIGSHSGATSPTCFAGRASAPVPTRSTRRTKAGYRATVETLLAGLTGPDPAGDAVASPRSDRPRPRPRRRPIPPAGMAAQRQRRAVGEPAVPGPAALVARSHDRHVDAPSGEADPASGTAISPPPSRRCRYAELHVPPEPAVPDHRAAGNFEALTQAVAKDPAMMLWLDTADQRGRPPERELRPRADGAVHPRDSLRPANYSETDVKEAARAFTGWSLVPATGQFVLRPRRHDNGVKTFLGQSGNFDGTDIVRIVTHQPASARVRRRQALEPPGLPGGAHRPDRGRPGGAATPRTSTSPRLLRAILLHPAFTSPTAKQGLVKQPIEWVVGMARAFGAQRRPEPAAAGGDRPPARRGRGQASARTRSPSACSPCSPRSRSTHPTSAAGPRTATGSTPPHRWPGCSRPLVRPAPSTSPG